MPPFVRLITFCRRFPLTRVRFSCRCTQWRVDEGERHRRSRLITGELQPLRVAAQLSSTGRDPQPYIRGLRRDLTSTHPTLDEPRHHPLYSENTVTESYALAFPLVNHALLRKLIDSTLYDLFFILFPLILYFESIFIIEKRLLSDMQLPESFINSSCVFKKNTQVLFYVLKFFSQKLFNLNRK